MFEQIVLGAIQGITEWIPVSSKTCVILAKIHFFPSPTPLKVNDLIQYALLLHLGTLFAAVLYFKKDIIALFKALASPQKAEPETQKVLIFLTITTVLTGLGWFLTEKIAVLAHSAPHAKAALMSIIAALLIVTGFLQLKTQNTGKRTPKDLTILDGVILGLVQAIATLPGLSRAGTTIAALSFRNVDKESALKLSFLMSLPVIFIGNIVKNYKALMSLGVEWVGVLVSFLVGILSIGILMNFAKRVNFGGFLIFIGSIMAIATILGIID